MAKTKEYSFQIGSHVLAPTYYNLDFLPRVAKATSGNCSWPCLFWAANSHEVEVMTKAGITGGPHLAAGHRVLALVNAEDGIDSKTGHY